MVQHSSAVYAARTGTANRREDVDKRDTFTYRSTNTGEVLDRCFEDVMPLASRYMLAGTASMLSGSHGRTRGLPPELVRRPDTAHAVRHIVHLPTLGKSRRAWMLLCVSSWSVHAPQLCTRVSESRRHRIQCILYTVHMCHVPACTQMSRLSSGKACLRVCTDTMPVGSPVVHN